MILLTSTSDKISLTTTDIGNIQVQASYVDLSGTTVTPGRLNTIITTATTTDIVASPASSTQRNVKFLSVFNNSSEINKITVLHTDGTTTVDLYQVSLPSCATALYLDGQGWTLYGTNRPINIQTFSADGTWNKPTSFTPKAVHVRMWGAGGGGGGGGSSAVGIAKGGGGGGGGCRTEYIFMASSLTSTVAVTIGQGGTAGTGTAGGLGGAGGNGGTTTFGSYLSAYGGAGGAGGANTSTATLGGGGGGCQASATSSTGGQPTSVGPGIMGQGITGVSAASVIHYGEEGGGGGGGSTNVPVSIAGGGSLFGGGAGGSGGHHGTGPVNVAGSDGGGSLSGVGGGGTAGTNGATPTDGQAGIATDGTRGGTGGGGGGTTITATVAGAAGGAGGLGGGGGGGGGCGMNPGPGGVGGVGGNGYCVVISW